jgi:YidC/Oxa1 family membrane protein insertase
MEPLVELWHAWPSLLETLLTALSSHFGLSQAAAIVVLTLLARFAAMPLTLSVALAAQVRRERIHALKPELAQLKARHADDPGALSRATLALYRAHGVGMLDRLALLNAGWQGLFGVGVYQALGHAAYRSRFLWIASLARPDLWLALLAGTLTAAGMALAPNAAEPAMLVMLAVALCVVVATTLAMPASLGLYWASSNAASLVQAAVVRRVAQKRRAARS